MGEVLVVRLLPKPEHAAARAEFIERWAANDPRAYLSALKGLVNWSVMEALPRIDQPVLVLTGDRDYTPVAVKRAYTALTKNAELVVIADARHFMPIERPEPFNDALKAFLHARHSEKHPCSGQHRVTSVAAQSAQKTTRAPRRCEASGRAGSAWRRRRVRGPRCLASAPARRAASPHESGESPARPPRSRPLPSRPP